MSKVTLSAKLTDRKNQYAEYLLKAEQIGQEALLECQRDLCKTDVYFLLRYVCQRPDAERQWVLDRCLEVQANPDNHLDLWSRGHYKLQRLSEPVPTPNRWKLHGDLKPGDQVFGSDGKPCNVIARTPVFQKPKLYKITFDDGTENICGEHHIWRVLVKSLKRVKGNKREGRVPCLKYTHEIAAWPNSKNAKRLAVTMAMPLDLPHAKLPIPPYTLGAWLGDGTNANGMITKPDGYIFERVKGDGYEIGKCVGAEKKGTRTVYGLMPQLRAIGVLGNKHIPDQYLWASIEQRRALVQGLMDTDGHVNTRGTATYVTKTEALAEGIRHLLVSLGVRVKKRKYTAYHGEYWQVSFEAYEDDRLITLPRKAVRTHRGERKARMYRRYIVSCEAVASEPGSCIQVDSPDGMYLVGKDMIPTHNSTVVTFALTLQEIINNPEITICIMSHTRGIAKGFLRQIKRELENNVFLRGLFPEIFYEEPQRNAPTWSEDNGLVVRRIGNPKEATLESWGLVDSQPTAKHYDLIVYDDVVTVDSVSTPEQIAKTTEAYELSLNLAAEHGRKRLVGTRYHLYDTYQEIIKRGNIKARIYPGTHNGQVDGEPVLWTKKQLGEKRIEMGHATFACQVLCNPKADEVDGFEYNDLRFWDATNPGNLNLYIIVDAASKKKKSSDYTSMVVVGLGTDDGVYVVDIIRDRLNLEERANKLFELHRQYKPIAVGYEEYGMMADIEHMQYRMNRENYHFDIIGLKGKTAKEDRIKKLLPATKKHLFFLPRYCWHRNYEGRNVDVAQAFIQEEYVPFPYGSHDDVLDSISRIVESADELGAIVPNTKTQQSYRRMRAHRAASGVSAWGA